MLLAAITSWRPGLLVLLLGMGFAMSPLEVLGIETSGRIGFFESIVSLGGARLTSVLDSRSCRLYFFNTSFKASASERAIFSSATCRDSLPACDSSFSFLCRTSSSLLEASMDAAANSSSIRCNCSSSCWLTCLERLINSLCSSICRVTTSSCSRASWEVTRASSAVRISCSSRAADAAAPPRPASRLASFSRSAVSSSVSPAT
mmetsp:Transcript_38312/g.73411  ORF Transcript_38312/g.73411 Transcript_38312/m.73411 type:complete len:204 (+) Transcript_38312:1045-1656(+)